MTISETMTLVRTAKKALKEAEEREDICRKTVKRLLSEIPHEWEDIANDFNNFCNNSLSVINEDFEDIRDPNEVLEDIEEAVDIVINNEMAKSTEYLEQNELNLIALARCNAYLSVRDRWLAEICDAIEKQ